MELGEMDADPCLERGSTSCCCRPEALRQHRFSAVQVGDLPQHHAEQPQQGGPQPRF
jgi:hypothetical protein